MKNNSFLFLCGIYPPQLLKKIVQISRNRLNFSGHKFTTVLLKGFLDIENIKLSILTMPKVGSFPSCNTELYTQKETFSLFNKFEGKSIFLINIMVLKKVISFLSGAIYSLKWLIKERKNECTIIVCPSEIHLLLINSLLRFLHIRFHSCLIILDIPNFTLNDENISWIKKKLFHIENLLSVSLLRQFDSYVLLTDSMADYLKLKNKPYVVVEGVVDSIEDIDRNIKIDIPLDKKIVLYTGSLNRQYGVTRLIELLDSIQRDDFELWICGAGECEFEIKEKAKTDIRLRYLGVQSLSYISYLQKNAYILINPRINNGEFNKYSFPSKLMEYLLSGTPAIVSPLPGIPSEYYNYFFVPEDDSIDSLKELLNSLLDKSKAELEKRGNAGKKFVLEKKNSAVQVNRIVKMIFSLYAHE